MPWNEVMDKWKAGTLRSGGTGPPVKNQGQAVAIMLNEKRKAAAGQSEYAASPREQTNHVIRQTLRNRQSAR